MRCRKREAVTFGSGLAWKASRRCTSVRRGPRPAVGLTVASRKVARSRVLKARCRFWLDGRGEIPRLPACRPGRPGSPVTRFGNCSQCPDRGRLPARCRSRSTPGVCGCCRSPLRPVLKHGPRSLTRARGAGQYETREHSESETRRDPSEREAHRRPILPAASGRSSKSVLVGTRKMVNYA